MDELELRSRIARMVLLVKSSVDYSFMLKDNLHREDKVALNRYVSRANGFVKFFIGDSLKDEEIDDIMEDGAEYYLEGTELLAEALSEGKGEEVLKFLRTIK